MTRLVRSWSKPHQLLVTIIMVSVLLRVASALYLGDKVVALPGTFDQLSYHRLALRLLDGHGFSFGERWWPATRANEPTAHWSYLYTLYLAAVYVISGSSPLVARLLQAVLVGVVLPWLVYRVACRVFECHGSGADAGTTLSKGQKTGLAAAAIAAVYVYFVYYAATLMTESFYTVAILWSFDTGLQIKQSKSSRWHLWLLLGLAWGIAVLLRQLFLLFIPFFLLWLLWANRPKLRYLLLSVIVLLGMILPWTLRNYRAFDQFVLLNTNAGYALFWGNHEVHGTKFVPILTPDMGSYYSLIPPELLHLNEAALDTELLKLALRNIFEDPGRYLLLSLSRIPPYFLFWPLSGSSMISNVSRVASFGLFFPAMLYGLFRSLRDGFVSLRDGIGSPIFLLYLFIVVYTGIHVLTWTLVRYRLPVDAILLIFAGLAIVDVMAGIKSRRERVHTRVA